MTQFKKEVTTLRVNKLALAVALGLSLGLAGCGDDQSVSNAVGVPNPNALMPTGTIQGRLVDTVTNEPIVGAVVDIGIAKATTTETGQFVISNVPATTDSVTGTIAGAYNVTVDLRQVKAAASGAKYPDFSYTTAAVNYTSLNDGSNDSGTSSSNHDTPVTGLVAPIFVKVGKLAAGIKGVVAKTETLAAVGAGYTVKLVSLGDAPNENSAVSGKGGTGALEHVVGTMTTDATGAFSFTSIESLRAFRIDVVNAEGTERGSEAVVSPADGQIKTLAVQNNDEGDLRTVLVSSTDTLKPFVLMTSPEADSDIAPDANVDIKFAFSESIKENAYTKGLTASSVGGLYADVAVNFDGAKASNIPHTLAWNATRTELTVSIPNVAASSKYSVDLTAAAAKLEDMSNNFIDLKGKERVEFTTNGAVAAVAPSNVVVTNLASLGDTGMPMLDWSPVSGAASYNIYRAKGVVAADGTSGSFGALERIATGVAVSEFTDANLQLVEDKGQVKVVYKYIVRSVNRDKLVSADSNAVEAKDMIPTAPAPTIALTNSEAKNNALDDSGTPALDWLPVSGATGYNVYVAKGNEPFVKVNDALVTGSEFFAPSVDFVDTDNQKVTYKYVVRSISSDGAESADSVAVTATDVVKPTVGFMSRSGKTIQIFFSEAITESAAETNANYALAVTTGAGAPAVAPTIPALVSSVYANGSVTLTFADTVPSGTTMTVTGVTDISGNAIAAASQSF